MNLEADTEYEFALALTDGPTASVEGHTWSNIFPIKSTVILAKGISHETLRITEGGSPDGYKLYTADPAGTTIDVANGADTCVSVEADYVIVRGLTCRGAKVDGLRVGNQRNVAIEGCEITNWGRPDPQAGATIKTGEENINIMATLGAFLDAGIHIAGPDSEQIIIQGNRIHRPRYTANNWTQVSPYFSRENYLSTHPQGPDAIVFEERTAGRHVIRWNNIGNDTPDFDHMFNDGMLASEPKGNGFIGDGDIYGNRISDCWDDGIEAERGERNVRIWDNHFSRVIKCVSTGYIWEGPLYVWRNVAADLLHPNDMPAYNGGHSPFKAHPPCFMPPPQEDPKEQRDGVVYVYHNTMAIGSGAPAGWAFNTWPPFRYVSPTARLISRNNVWETGPYPAYFNADNPDNNTYYVRDYDNSYFDQDYDLHNGIITPEATAGAHTIQAQPVFQNGHNGPFVLAEKTPGNDDAMLLPNFKDDYLGKGPDRGAHERGSKDSEYGVALWRKETARAR